MEKRRYGTTGCDFAGCPKPHSSRGYCKPHADQLRRGVELKPLQQRGVHSKCSFDGCDQPYSAGGYCKPHYDQLRYGAGLKPLRPQRSGCSVDGCPEPHRSLGWCEFHYGRWQRLGDPLAEPTPRRRWSPGPCDFPGCTNVRGGKRWYCPPHARQLLRGEELHPLPPPVNAQRKYVIDHHFFDVIDTEEKAYWLGFITADGCVAKRYLLTINLKAADAGHLEKLGAALSSDYPIRPSGSGKPGAGIVRWHANSIPLVRALGAVGVTPRKSATATPWDGPTDLMRHYWRGLVDGDGGMGLYARRPGSPRQWCLNLCGSRDCVEAFARWASEICGSRAQPKSRAHSRDCWYWSVAGNRMTPPVVRELYGDCTVSLDRKQALADAMLAMAARS